METEKINKYNNGGRALGGLVVIAAGVILLIKQLNLVFFPTWLFTWPVFLIALGLFIAFRSGFRGRQGLALILIGGVFLFPKVYWYYTGLSISAYSWPLLLIVVGLWMMFHRRQHRWDSYSHYYKHKWHHHGHGFKNKPFENIPFENAPFSGQTTGETSSEDFVDETSVFGGIHKVVVSKNFKGGEIVNIFGGCDLNLTQADFTGEATLDVTQIFGGTKIVVPTDWKIVTKMTSVFGGIEDKRPPALVKENPAKTLIIDGTSIFAGISLQCY